MPIPQGYLTRTIEPVIKEVSEIFKVVLLTGIRQCGKSTCLQHLANAEGKRQSLTMDDAMLRSDAELAPGFFFKLHPTPLLIDEIQRTPKLFLQMKAEVDAKSEFGQIWATGSQKFSLMKGVSESLAGRLIPLELMPLSIYERQGLGLEQKPYVPSINPTNILPSVDKDHIWQTIWQGAWPGVINASPRQRRFFYDALISTYLERDIQLTSGVSKINEFRIFLQMLASLTGQELRIGALANAVGVSEPTIKAWLSTAQASGIIYYLRPYFSNINKQLVKSPKVYFTDTGLAAYLCGLSSPDALCAYKDAGAFFETFVITEILKSWVHNGEHADFFFYRDSRTREEIDLLIRHNGTLYPVEIKMGSHPGADAIKHFKVLNNLPEPIGHGAVICTTESNYGLSNRCTAHSVWRL